MPSFTDDFHPIPVRSADDGWGGPDNYWAISSSRATEPPLPVGTTARYTITGGTYKFWVDEVEVSHEEFTRLTGIEFIPRTIPGVYARVDEFGFDDLM